MKMREMRQWWCIVVIAWAFGIPSATASKEDLIHGYECRESRCIKVELNEENFQNAISLPVCRLFCSENLGTLWPKPTGRVRFDPVMLHIDTQNVNFNFPAFPEKLKSIWQANEVRFMELIHASVPNREVLRDGGYPLDILVQIGEDESTAKAKQLPKLTLDTNENYALRITKGADNRVTAEISAKSYFGARHGLETLSQLIVYDDIRREVQMLSTAEIEDGPVYKWRGLLLDTSRNFYSTKAIKRTLDGMAVVKLNTFHWHITDSHSFPLEVKSQKDLYKLGAYSPRKVYSHEDIAEIVEYGLVRGIRVMPEFDAPAHVGEGWQHKNMTACFNAQPWRDYCVEPPCGQLDPTVDALYPVLEDIYREMFELFDPDVFHMGGDEVSVKCWNSSTQIKKWMTAKGQQLNEADFLNLWGYFQEKALERVDRISKIEKIPIILWTSHLTDVPYIDNYLDNQRYIIQIWTTGADSKVKDILERGFRIIVSNYDALYLDCGGAGWVNDGNNWCSPYIGWQKVYDNSLDEIAGEYKTQVYGAEAAIWSEQIDEFTVDSRFWPRASALAERLWANPTEGWRQAEARMLYHRERLVEKGLGAEALQPEWCLQNENECPINAYASKF